MKIALLECSNNDYKIISNLCSKSKIDYCKKNNYDYINYFFEDLSPYGPTWARVFAIEEKLSQYDWILYLDTDTIINNFSLKIEDSINNHNLIIGRMPDYESGILNHISTSAILIKNCTWSFDFLNIWKLQKKYISEPYFAKKDLEKFSTFGVGGLYFEQSAFHYLYDNYEDIRNNVYVHEDVWMNDRESTYNKNSFLIHFASERVPKLTRIKKFFKQNIKI